MWAVSIAYAILSPQERIYFNNYFPDTYFKPEPLSDRIFRGKFQILNDKWSMDLANQNSLRFQQKSRDYRERINLLVRRSDLREAYEGSEILALDG